MIPTKIFSHKTTQKSDVSVLRSINDLGKLEINADWLSLTSCKLSFQNLPTCLWGRQLPTISIDEKIRALNSKNSISVDGISEGKVIVADVSYNNSKKSIKISPPIDGVIRLCHDKSGILPPWFEVSSKQCKFKLVKDDDSEVPLHKEEGSDKYLIDKKEFGTVEETESWYLQIFTDSGKLLAKKQYNIDPPPLSFYKLTIPNTSLVGKFVEDKGLIAEFECLGLHPKHETIKGTFNYWGGNYGSEQDYDVVVENSKGTIFLDFTKFDFDSMLKSRTRLTEKFALNGDLSLEGHNNSKTHFEIGIKPIFVNIPERICADRSNSRIISYFENWHGEFKIILNNGTNKTITVNESNQDEKYSIKNLFEDFPTVRNSLQYNDKIQIRVDMSIFPNPFDLVKTFIIDLFRSEYAISSEDNIYPQPSWKFYCNKIYYPDPEKFQLKLVNMQFNPSEYNENQREMMEICDLIEIDVSAFGLEQLFDGAQTWELSYDGQEVLSGDLKFPEISIVNPVSEYFVFIDKEKESIDFTKLGSLNARTDIGLNLNMKITLHESEKIFEYELDNSKSLGPYLNINQIIRNDSKKLYDILSREDQDTIVGQISLIIPDLHDKEIYSTDISLIQGIGLSDHIHVDNWLREKWNGEMDQIKRSPNYNLALTFLISDLSRAFNKNGEIYSKSHHYRVDPDDMFTEKFSMRFSNVDVFNHKIESLLCKTRYFDNFVKSKRKLGRWVRHEKYKSVYLFWKKLKAKTRHREYEKMVSIVGKLESDSNV